MRICKLFSLAFFLITVILSSTLVISGPIPEPGTTETTTSGEATSPEPSGTSASTQETQKQVQYAVRNGGDATAETQIPITVTLEDRTQVTLRGKIKVEKGKITAGYLKTGDTEANDAEGFKKTDDGYTLDSAKSLAQGNNKIINGKGIKFKNGKLTAEHADSFIKDSSVTTNVNNLVSEADFFSVDSADSFLSDCLRADSIKDSEFKVSDKVDITTKSKVSLKITDCSYNEVEFEGKGKVSVDKSENPTYTVENGTLTRKEDNYNETIESNNSITVETDKTFGFKCLTIIPVGSYFYNDKDLRKDFIINIPKESSTYRLCLRKNQAQNFQAYNGLADFVDKKIELNGIVNYLRYPLKNNEISGILSDFLYKGLKNIKALLVYDKNLLFLNNVDIKNILENKQQIAITNPNNYYNIKEMELEEGKIHRIVELNNVDKNQLTQDMSYNYESDSLKPKIRISNNELVQGSGKGSITILPPGDDKINDVLK